MISYIEHKEIDKQKWDRCINLSPNGLVYACSWYLDIVSPGWDALVMGDYEFVMPLTVKKKLGLKCLFQPDYTQQLGVFSINNIEKDRLYQFLGAIYERYRLAEINLNFSNIVNHDKFVFNERVNYELNLNCSYEELYKNYSASNKDSIKRAFKKETLEIRQSITIAELIGIFKETVPVTIINKQVQTLNNLHIEAISRGICEMYGLYDNENRLVAASSFLNYKDRILFFTSISSEEGKRKRAMFQMLDFIIKKNAEKNLILDFEGSNILGSARFFAGFGPKETMYSQIKFNRLPLVIDFPLSIYRKLQS
jgi:hypothetical protein